MIYRTCEVPALGAAQAARTRAVPLCRFATFPPPRGGIVPQTPTGPIFSYGRKDGKRPFKRDVVPLKDSPVGEPSGRVPHTPTAGILGGNSKRMESQRVRSCCLKSLRLIMRFPESLNCTAGCFVCFGREVFGVLRV